ncbi:MAG: NAD(+)/NADH kinase [Bacteroidales bacterium]|nr:NAD(+)/NADH kinase [Bacteroidales bacterium]
MKIALYYRHLEPSATPCLAELTDALRRRGIETCELHDGDTADGCDYLFSIGGDGTLLSSVQFVRPDTPEAFPPVLGINFGHLGFLTTVGRENLHGMVDELLEGKYTLEERSLLQLSTTHCPLSTQYALNEVFVHRTEEASLLRTEVYAGGDYVATYAGDGVIVGTPTGSTAYSLSCGGPILTPDSRCLLITPISAHTLTLRPIIIPDTADIRLKVNDACFLGIDSRRITLDGGSELHLRRAPFTIRLVRLGQQNFFTAIREKLMWGTEVRS